VTLSQDLEERALKALSRILGRCDLDEKTFTGYFNHIAHLITPKSLDGKFVRNQIENDLHPRKFLVEKFGLGKGFDLFKNRLHVVADNFDTREGEGSQCPNFNSISTIILTLRATMVMLRENFLSRYVRSLCVDEKDEFALGLVSALSTHNPFITERLHKRLYDGLIDHLSHLLRTSSRVMAEKFKEQSQLAYIKFFLKSDKISQRSRGMAMFKPYIKALNPKTWQVGDGVLAQCSNGRYVKGVIAKKNEEYGVYDVRFSNGDVSAGLLLHQMQQFLIPTEAENNPEHHVPLKFITKGVFLEWLEENLFDRPRVVIERDAGQLRMLISEILVALYGADVARW